jgi:hypothetical protein
MRCLLGLSHCRCQADNDHGSHRKAGSKSWRRKFDAAHVCGHELVLDKEHYVDQINNQLRISPLTTVRRLSFRLVRPLRLDDPNSRPFG